jgi:hypothetical protein
VDKTKLSSQKGLFRAKRTDRKILFRRPRGQMGLYTVTKFLVTVPSGYLGLNMFESLG